MNVWQRRRGVEIMKLFLINLAPPRRRFATSETSCASCVSIGDLAETTWASTPAM